MIRTRTRLGKTAVAVALLGASGLATLAVVEIGLRLFWPQTLLHDPDAFLPDPILTGRLKPGFEDRFTSPEYATRWKINEAGYRGPSAGARLPGRPRIVAIGDSYTFGYGVEEEEAYPRRLEAILRAEHGVEVEVFNLGVGGYGTTQEVWWLREAIEEGIAPDVVILGFYPGNDLSDSIRGEGALAAARPGALPAGVEPGSASLPEASPSLRLKRYFGSRLHLYALISDRADGLLVAFGLRNVVYPEEVETLLTPPPENVLRGWEAVSKALEAMGNLVERHGAAAVVGIPMRHQVVAASWERVRAYHERVTGRPLTGADPDAPRRALAEACEGAGLPLLDLAPIFRADPDPARLYFARDQHWTREGHDLAARSVASWLLRERILEAGAARGRRAAGETSG